MNRSYESFIDYCNNMKIAEELSFNKTDGNLLSGKNFQNKNDDLMNTLKNNENTNLAKLYHEIIFAEKYLTKCCEKYCEHVQKLYPEVPSLKVTDYSAYIDSTSFDTSMVIRLESSNHKENVITLKKETQPDIIKTIVNSLTGILKDLSSINEDESKNQIINIRYNSNKGYMVSSFYPNK